LGGDYGGDDVPDGGADDLDLRAHSAEKQRSGKPFVPTSVFVGSYLGIKVPRPHGFVLTAWRDCYGGALRMGLEHGL
jgi:hypothetical protein